MALDYKIKITDRTNPANTVTFTKASEAVQSFDFELHRRGGCGASDVTLYRNASQWAALSSLLQPENFIEIWLDINVGTFGTHPDYMGSITKTHGDYCTPPRRLLRTINAYGLIKQLGRGGYLLLYAQENQTIQVMVAEILALLNDPNTDIATGIVTAGTTTTIDRVLFVDQPAVDCLKKLAEVNTATVYGVDARRRLFFKPETAGTATPVITVQMGDKHDGLREFSRFLGTPGPNAYIVEGRHAPSGNPMTIYVEDIESGGRLRMKKIKAPELVTGEHLIDWGEYLIDAHRDAPERITVPLEAIESDGVSRTVLDPNNNARVFDENGSLIDTWPIRVLNYRMTNGALGLTMELGDDAELDLVQTAKTRDMLREIRIFEAKELSNQMEIANDSSGWATDAYVEFVKTHRMRNSVYWTLDNDKEFVDFEHDENDGIAFSSERGGVTSNRGAWGKYGTLVSQPIEVGKVYNKFSMYRRSVYPRLIEQNPAGFTGTCEQWAHEGYRPVKFITDDEGGVMPAWSAYAFDDAEGFAIWPRSIAYVGRHKVKMRWEQPTHALSYMGRYYLFCVRSINAYAAIVMARSTATSMTFGLIKKFGDPVQTVWGFYHTLQVSGGTTEDELELTVDLTGDAAIYLNPVCTLENKTLGVTSGPWDPGVGFLDDLYDSDLGGFPGKIGLYAAYDHTLGMESDAWHIDLITFEDIAGSGGNGGLWQISRDGGDSWEPTGAGWRPDYVDLVDLGDYAGPGTALDTVLVKGYLQYPQTMSHYALAWKE